MSHSESTTYRELYERMKAETDDLARRLLRSSDSLFACVSDRNAAQEDNDALRAQLAVAVEALEEARYAVSALATTQNQTGLGLLGELLAPKTLARIDDALASLRPKERGGELGNARVVREEDC